MRLKNGMRLKRKSEETERDRKRIMQENGKKTSKHKKEIENMSK